jgi:Ni,Fe-hydrogenase III small subunit
MNRIMKYQLIEIFHKICISLDKKEVFCSVFSNVYLGLIVSSSHMYPLEKTEVIVSSSPKYTLEKTEVIVASSPRHYRFSFL